MKDVLFLEVVILEYILKTLKTQGHQNEVEEPLYVLLFKQKPLYNLVLLLSSDRKTLSDQLKIDI